jgi:anti-sigma B factor antagonist
MRIKEKQKGDVTLLTLKGDMIHDKVDLHPYVKNLIEDGKKKIVVDLGHIKWFSSTGLGALMASYTSLKNADGEMKIARPSRKIYSLIYQMELREVFDTFDTVDEAVEAFEE